MVRICPSAHATDSTTPGGLCDMRASQHPQSSCIYEKKSKNCAHKHIAAPDRRGTLGPSAPCGANRCAWPKDHPELHLALPRQLKRPWHLIRRMWHRGCRACTSYAHKGRAKPWCALLAQMDSSLHRWAQTKGRTITDVLFGAQIFTMRSTARAHGPGAQHGGIGAWRRTRNEHSPQPTLLLRG